MTHFADFKINFFMYLLFFCAAPALIRVSRRSHSSGAAIRSEASAQQHWEKQQLSGFTTRLPPALHHNPTDTPTPPLPTTVLPFRGNRQLTWSAWCKTSFVSWQRRNENILGGRGGEKPHFFPTPPISLLFPPPPSTPTFSI